MKTDAAVQKEISGPLHTKEVELLDAASYQITVKLFSDGVCHSQPWLERYTGAASIESCWQ